tara:strand:+ start:694 stop:1041 length:348 start_codon:yes stop_codon:yes gene_type:complete
MKQIYNALENITGATINGIDELTRLSKYNHIKPDLEELKKALNPELDFGSPLYFESEEGVNTYYAEGFKHEGLNFVILYEQISNFAPFVGLLADDAYSHDELLQMIVEELETVNA